MKKTKIFPIIAAAVITVSAAAGCGRKGYDDFVIPEQGPSTLRPVSDIYISNHYEGVAPIKEKTNRKVKSDDGLCVIECKDSYTMSLSTTKTALLLRSEQLTERPFFPPTLSTAALSNHTSMRTSNRHSAN